MERSVPPPSVPPPDSSADEEEPKASTTNSYTSTAACREPTRVSTLKREEKEKRQRERMEKERRELEEKRVKEDEMKKEESSTTAQHHPSLGERQSYVEEPPSTTTTLDRRDRKAEKALVRRITNEMQMATYVQQIDLSAVKQPVGAYTQGVFRIRMLRFAEAAIRRMLWSVGKFLANHKLISLLIALAFFASSIILPVVNRQHMFIDLPFSHIFGSGSDVISNGIGIVSKSQEFNSSNPAFSCMNWRDSNHFAVLLRTIQSRDTILRKDAVLAYTALKKKLDHFPVEKREFLVQCSLECENDKDMVDRIIKKSPQVALTYPETFVSMSKDSTNLTRVYLGAAIGGVETDTDGAISKATSLLMNFELKDDLSGKEHAAWHNHFEDQTRLTAAPNISLMAWSPETFKAAVVATLHDQYWCLQFCLAILFLSCLIGSFGINAYQSKPCLGIMIFVTLVAVSIAGFSMQFYRNLPVDPLVYPICFVTIGIGLLWLFQLHFSWSRYSSAAVHPTEKIAFILSHDAPGIAASAVVIVTTFLTMGLVISNGHMVSSFLGIASSVAILLVFTIFFISVFVFVGGSREARGVKWYQIFKTGDTQFTSPQLASFDSSSLFSLHDRLLDARPCASRAVGAFVISPKIRYPILVLCTAFIFFAIYGFVNTGIDIKEEYFLPSASSEKSFIEQYREQFGKTTQFMELTIENSIEYHDHEVQNNIFDIMDFAIEEGYATRAVNWLSEFAKFEKASIYDVNPDTFVPVVNLVFLPSETYRKYASDIIMDRFQTQIIKSRMYLELTVKGFAQRTTFVDTILKKAAAKGIPLSVDVPSSMSLRHDISVFTSGMVAFGVAIVMLFFVSLLLLGQPALTVMLLITSIAVLGETVGYAYFWSVPMNIVTLTMALAGNALTCVIVMAFCYSYSMSGKSQIRAGVRIQYTFQATLVPVLFACIVPVLTFLPLLYVDVPVVHHLFKIVVLNAAASLIHYLFFLPNMMLAFSERFGFSCTSLNCAELCCDMDDESSIYYIPTGGRAIHPEGLYHHPSYTYAPKPLMNAPPPHYLAITAPPVNSIYGQADYASRGELKRESRRHRRRSESSIGETENDGTPRRDRESRRRRQRRAMSRDSEIYEDLPSPQRPVTSSSRSNSPRRQQPGSIRRPGAGPGAQQPRPQAYHYDEGAQWRPYVQPSPYMFYSGPVYGQQQGR
uniref:SSD domain-containing protein n=4 Tax=Caenorhabditis japonica TaxID=281687 RepID=A0A8R1I0S8_CAEJA